MKYEYKTIAIQLNLSTAIKGFGLVNELYKQGWEYVHKVASYECLIITIKKAID